MEVKFCLSDGGGELISFYAEDYNDVLSISKEVVSIDHHNYKYIEHVFKIYVENDTVERELYIYVE